MAFVPRLTDVGMMNNPMWYSGNYYYNAGYGLPNCTCYAYGRFWEINGSVPPGLGGGNGGQWYDSTDGSLLTKNPSIPVLGAIACWYSPSGTWQGHVAVVEEIQANGNITTSNSYWKGTYFATETNYKDAYGSNQYLAPWMYTMRDYRLKGFIYPLQYDQPAYQWICRVSDGSQAYLNQSEMEANAIIIYSYLYYKGWTLNAICGALGSMQRESTLNPGACEGGHGVPSGGVNYAGGLGLIQWTDYPPYTGALNPILWYGQHVNKDWYDGNVQLEMLDLADDPVVQHCGTPEVRFGWALPSNYPVQMTWQEYKQTDMSPEDAAYAFFCGIEYHTYPPPSAVNIPQRQQNARNWYNYLVGVAPIPPLDYPNEARNMLPWMYLKPRIIRPRRRY